jgi:hypothetical protein
MTLTAIKKIFITDFNITTISLLDKGNWANRNNGNTFVIMDCKE